MSGLFSLLSLVTFLVLKVFVLMLRLESNSLSR